MDQDFQKVFPAFLDVLPAYFLGKVFIPFPQGVYNGAMLKKGRDRAGLSRIGGVHEGSKELEPIQETLVDDFQFLVAAGGDHFVVEIGAGFEIGIQVPIPGIDFHASPIFFHFGEVFIFHVFRR